MTKTFPKQQQGVALAVSLIFLVIITIIGVASIRGTTMNEMMAANAQQKSMSFQIAESVIEGVWDTGYILKNTPTDLTDPPADILTNDMNDVVFNDMFDIAATSSKPGLAVNANATLQYCGQSFQTVGTQLTADESVTALVSHIYSIHGIGEIPAANAKANHDQRGFLVRPDAGRTGNCP